MSIKNLTNRIGSAFDSIFGIGDQGGETFHFFGNPADVGVAMVAAAGLFGAVAAQERPVLRAPVIEPKAILGAHFLAQLFKGWIGPGAIFVRGASQIREVARANFAREGRRDDL